MPEAETPPRLFDPALPPSGRDVAPVGHRHPETSKAAAERALPRTGSKRRHVLALIRRAGDRGMTCDEIEAETGWTHQSASPKVTGLRDDGWITDSGVRRTIRSGNEAIAWTLTDEARAALAEEHT